MLRFDVVKKSDGSKALVAKYGGDLRFAKTSPANVLLISEDYQPYRSMTLLEQKQYIPRSEIGKVDSKGAEIHWHDIVEGVNNNRFKIVWDDSKFGYRLESLNNGVLYEIEDPTQPLTIIGNIYNYTMTGHELLSYLGGEDLEYDIFSVFIGDIEHDHIKIINKDPINNINHRGSLEIIIDDIIYTAIVRDGNFDGSVIEEFGIGVEYKKLLKPTGELKPKYPDNCTDDEKTIINNKFKINQSRLQTIHAELHYDITFQPTDITQKCYRDFMSKFNLELVYEE